METTEAQKRFVASNALSIAQAHFEPTAEFRAIYADEGPVGFIMWRQSFGTDSESETRFLWRFMIDRRHQGHGYGRAALELLVGRLRSEGVDLLVLSYVAGDEGPGKFYRAFGFRDTGERLPNGECLMELEL